MDHQEGRARNKKKVKHEKRKFQVKQLTFWDIFSEALTIYYIPFLITYATAGKDIWMFQQQKNLKSFHLVL